MRGVLDALQRVPNVVIERSDNLQVLKNFSATLLDSLDFYESDDAEGNADHDGEQFTGILRGEMLDGGVGGEGNQAGEKSYGVDKQGAPQGIVGGFDEEIAKSFQQWDSPRTF